MEEVKNDEVIKAASYLRGMGRGTPCPRCGELIAIRGYSMKASLIMHHCSQCECCGKWGYLFGIYHNNCPKRK